MKNPLTLQRNKYWDGTNASTEFLAFGVMGVSLEDKQIGQVFFPHNHSHYLL